MIEDKELRDLFRMESEEHLQCLDDGLLSLEQRPADKALLDDIFRAAHSIKGSARMLGLNEIQTLAHNLEDSLGAIRNGAVTVDKNMAADLYQKLAVVRHLVEDAVGESIGTDALPASSPESSSESKPVVIKPAVVEQVAEAISETPKPESVPVLPAEPVNIPEAKKTSFQIGTIRIDPQRLDVLLTHAGELAVTNAHIARRLLALDTLVDSCEEWTRSLKAMGLSIQDENFTLKGLSQLQTLLIQLRSGLYEDSRRLDFVSEQLENGIRTIRLLPFSTIFNQFPRLVHELAESLHKDVELAIEGAEVVVDKRILEELKDPIMHLLRNAICHGLEDSAQRINSGKPSRGKIVLRASQSADHIILDVQDDGRGLDLAEIKRTALKQGLYNSEQLASMNDDQIQSLILASGFTTTKSVTELSGRGVGLDVVCANIEKLKGSLQVYSTPGKGVTFRLLLPLTLATMRVQIVSVRGRSYALPLETVQFSRRIKASELFTMEGRQTFSLEGQPVAVVYLGDLLALQNPKTTQAEVLYSTFLRVEHELFGLIVDELLDETEVVLKAQSKLLKRVRNVSATTILVSGEVCPVLNPSDLLKSMRKQYGHGGRVAIQPAAAPMADDKRKKILLLAEDSITTRTQEKRILESAGYAVVTAVDGLDAYTKFQSGQFDGVVSDVEMPNMSGLALAEAIRKDKQHADIPIILVTSLSSEADQRRGLEAGANAYLVKSGFDQKVLLDCLARLV
jgi:two-component system chemotaxis sensor kinase CheA